MAHLMKSAGVTYRSPLARADFGRQRDIYKLALMGSGDCRRLWAEFAAEVPGSARLVVADVESDRRETAKVTKSLDKRMAKAEQVVRPAKASKAIDRRLAKAEKHLRAADAMFEGPAAMPSKATKGRKRVPASTDPFSPAAMLNSPDPAVREMARKVLGG